MHEVLKARKVRMVQLLGKERICKMRKVRVLRKVCMYGMIGMYVTA